MPPTTTNWKPSAIKEHYSRVLVPALNFAGWHDLFLGGSLRISRGCSAKVARLRSASGSAALLIGPWSHGVFTGLFPEHNYGVHSGEEAIDHTMVQLRFFDRHLKGLENGVDSNAPVRLFVMGSNVWRDEQEWPLARQRLPLVSACDGRAAVARGDTVAVCAR